MCNTIWCTIWYIIWYATHGVPYAKPYGDLHLCNQMVLMNTFLFLSHCVDRLRLKQHILFEGKHRTLRLLKGDAERGCPPYSAIPWLLKPLTFASASAPPSSNALTKSTLPYWVATRSGVYPSFCVASTSAFASSNTCTSSTMP